MEVLQVDGQGFTHLALQRFASPPGNQLHIYIEGDGVPWVGNLPSADPTPQNKLALRLAIQDPLDIVYLGRPCYFGFADDDGCLPKYWTSDRYGEEVLLSMAAAIQEVRQPRHTELVLIGHSGGGALAALLETRVPDVVGVITVGANVDTEKWTKHHGYDGLAGSNNPATVPRDGTIPHLQLVGAKDRTVPAYTTEAFADNGNNVQRVVFDDFDHVCCWEQQWPEILAGFFENRGE